MFVNCVCQAILFCCEFNYTNGKSIGYIHLTGTSYLIKIRSAFGLHTFSGIKIHGG